MTDTYACGIQMFRPEGDLYKILGAARWFTDQEIVDCGYASDIQDPAVHYAWKALSDPAYRALYDRRGDTKSLFDAGFFNDGMDHIVREYGVYAPTWPSMNLNKVIRNCNESAFDDRLAVLVTTGGMAPIHTGHVAMMETARKQLEDQGIKVIGGYFAPGHDSYVGQKYGGTAAIDVADRVAMVELAVQDSDWLEVNPWAARYMPAEINFTDVVRHLSSVLDYHLNHAADVYYVCGEDNEGFRHAMDNVIVVKRTAISSKLAREGDHSFLDARVAEYYRNIGVKDTGTLPYLIRNEEDQAIRNWADIMPGGMEELTRRRIQLQSAVRLGIAQLFKNQGHQHKVHLLPVSQQRVEAEKVIAGRRTISLDPFFKGNRAIDSTRYFELSDAQFKPVYRGPRCSYPGLEIQARNIPAGKYVLVEDDTVTGGTIMSALSLLAKDVEVEETVILSDFADYAGTEYYDVVDMRDFIFGSHCGGLGVVLPLRAPGNEHARAPYVLPFVSLRARAKIPAAAEMEVSRVIWQSNARFFKDSNIRIENADVGFRHLANYLGFSAKMSMEQFCQWGIECLMENV